MNSNLPRIRNGANWLEHGARSMHAHVMRPIVHRLNSVEAYKVLDLGCGDGWITGALDRCGFDAVGVDHDAGKLAVARHQYPHVRFEQMDLMQRMNLGLAMGFDAVVAVDVIDHVPFPRKLVGAALEALRPGGILIVTAAYFGYTKNLALAIAGRFDARWDPLLDEGRLKFFSRATLTALLSEYKLEQMHFETIGRIPSFARAMMVSATTPRPSA
jgi:2-polyprenyl-6-hydroxyphenyl methylase/3-demethylubiquinone-9 3-methyltransferase